MSLQPPYEHAQRPPIKENIGVQCISLHKVTSMLFVDWTSNAILSCLFE
jgi:hypothetical protein